MPINYTPPLLSKKDFQNFVQSKVGETLFNQEEEKIQQIISGKFDYCNDLSLLESLPHSTKYITMMNMAASVLVHAIKTIELHGTKAEKTMLLYMNDCIDNGKNLEVKLNALIALISTDTAKKVMTALDEEANK